jgi:chromosome segregation ATPase
MWPFKSKTPDKDTEEKLWDLQKRMTRLEEDWSEVYGKFRTMQMRVAKQAQRLDQAPETETAQRAEGDAVRTSLSTRQQELNAKILAMRQRGGNGGLLHG